MKIAAAACVAVVAVLAVGAVQAQDTDPETVVVLELPELKSAWPYFLKSHEENAVLTLGFEEALMNENTGVMLSLRGAGYWNEELDCANVNATFVECGLPVFFLTGEVEMRVMFNASSLSPSPLLPLGHSLHIWDVTIHSLTPKLLCRSSPVRNVTLLAEGLFFDEERDNVVVEVRGAMDFRLRRENVHVISAVKAVVTLPTDLNKGRYEFAISVDEGNTFLASPSSLQVYEVSIDKPTLGTTPAAGPVQGGSSVVIRGVYGVLVSESLLVKLETQVYEPNHQGELVPRKHSVVATGRTNDQIKPFLHLANNPVITFTTPATTVPGVYSISICDQPATGAYVALPGLRFEYYSLEIHGVTPMASPIMPMATSIQFLAPHIPRTGKFVARYGRSLTNAAGHTFEYLSDEECNMATIVPHPRVLPGNYSSIEAITCPLPSLGVKAARGTVLSLDVSANGQDFNTPSKAHQFLFYDVSVVDMTPRQGGNAEGHVVTISGRGFMDIPGMQVRLTTPSGDEYTVPARFFGESRLAFSPPKIPPVPSGSVEMTVALLVTPVHAIPLPSYTYDTSPPALSRIVVDSGNPFSDAIACIGSNVTIRVLSPSPLHSVALSHLAVGGAQLFPVPRFSRARDAAPGVEGMWVARFGVEEGMVGRVGFVVRVESDAGNEGEWGDDSALVDKVLTVEGTRPGVDSFTMVGQDASNPNIAFSGDTITALVKASEPLRAVTVDAVTVGDRPVINFATLQPESVTVQTVGGFPSRAWKVQWSVPQDVAKILGTPDAARELGPVHLRLTMSTVVGNKRGGVSERDGAAATARVTLKRRPGEGVDMSVFNKAPAPDAAALQA